MQENEITRAYIKLQNLGKNLDYLLRNPVSLPPNIPKKKEILFKIMENYYNSKMLKGKKSS